MKVDRQCYKLDQHSTEEALQLYEQLANWLPEDRPWVINAVLESLGDTSRVVEKESSDLSQASGMTATTVRDEWWQVIQSIPRNGYTQAMTRSGMHVRIVEFHDVDDRGGSMNNVAYYNVYVDGDRIEGNFTLTNLARLLCKRFPEGCS